MPWGTAARTPARRRAGAAAPAGGGWHVGRLRVERGARVEWLWQAAALGMTERALELLAADPAPTQEELNNAFWQACHGGQLRMAQLLLARGADINATPDYADGTPLDIAGSTDTRRGQLVSWLRDHGATS